jgi:hypothetical protein
MAKSVRPTTVYQLKITLQGIGPPIWRRVQVQDCTLAKLHDLIQTCFGWEGYHLHVFEVGGEQYGGPDPDGMMEYKDERRAKLSQIVARGHKKFAYVYDFGDNWGHVIQVEKTLPAEAGVHYPRCIAGKRACPPEDCGGPWGYQELLEAIGNPRNKRHEELLEWLGDEFDPEKCDLDAINEEL